MKRRKRIGFFAAFPEIVHVRRVLEGIMCQCKKYDYDLCVFSPSIHLSFPHDDYLKGEANIYNLANLEDLDGIILDTTTLTGDTDNMTQKKLMERLSQYENLPVCSLEIPVEKTKLIGCNNEEALREMCRHVIEVHGKKKICLLTGQQGNNVAEQRLSIFLDEIQKHGLEVLPEHIVYGDFWYFGGDALARKICANEIERPEAVLCASDCMAIGLVDYLVKHGVRVPEDIIVLGFDSSDEAVINLTTITSYEPADMVMGAESVDYLRSVMEPGAEIMPCDYNVSLRFHAGASCGCHIEPVYAMKRFRDAMYISSYNQADEDFHKEVGLGLFMESYAQEAFTGSNSAEECIRNIRAYVDLLTPYRNFYLCLKENWLNMEDVIYEGYPEKMKIYISSIEIDGETHSGEGEGVSFPTKEMLPGLGENEEKPSVYYFSPVHFNGVLLGYTVLQRDLKDQPMLNIIYRNWLRYINNALELIRSKERLQTISVRDAMTGAYNRRGMYERYREMLAGAKEDDALFVSVVDMDGLKYVNDTFGHSEGDFGIKTVCSTLMSMAGPDEICVRSGGDEFFLIGIGKYTKDDEASKAIAFSDRLAEISKKTGKPYNVSASIGCIVYEDCRQVSLDGALSEADERMYRYKVKNRRHRSV